MDNIRKCYGVFGMYLPYLLLSNKYATLLLITTNKLGAIFVGAVLVLLVIAVAEIFGQADARPQRGPFCHGQPATIIGTQGNDNGKDNPILLGTDGPDVIVGLGGDDFIVGFGGDDIICAGDGNDLVCGDDCALTEEGGNDKIIGGKGIDNLFGEGGNDTIFGNDDMDVIFGGFGNDNLGGGPGDDFLFGEQGDDRLTGLDGFDQLSGGTGEEVRGDICASGEINDECENIVTGPPQP